MKVPLTPKGDKIKEAMKKQYGKDKAEQVFYASRNKGTIKGVDPESGGKGGKGAKPKASGRKPKGFK
jgi:hypothetical protein